MPSSILEIGPQCSDAPGDKKNLGYGQHALAAATATTYECGVFERFKSAPTETTYALLRIVSGLLFSFHGFKKVLGFHAKFQPPVGSQLWIGGVIEIVCGLCIALGVYTRLAAFVASGTMAVAYTQFHWKLAFDERFWPAVNQGELALVYAFLFLFLASRGAGKWAMRPGKAGAR